MSEHGYAIYDTSPSGLRRALFASIQKQIGPNPIRVPVFDELGAIRHMKGMIAVVDALERPINVPTAQEIVMRQELGEFDA